MYGPGLLSLLLYLCHPQCYGTIRAIRDEYAGGAFPPSPTSSLRRSHHLARVNPQRYLIEIKVTHSTNFENVSLIKHISAIGNNSCNVVSVIEDTRAVLGVSNVSLFTGIWAPIIWFPSPSCLALKE